jgi:acyl-CoA thioesterase I
VRLLTTLRIAAAFILFAGGLNARAAGTSDLDRCLSVASGLSLNAPLPHTRTKLRAGQPLTLVALGSSSTAGIGGMGTTYPGVLQAELTRLHPSVRITVINSGRSFKTVPGDLARLDIDVLRYRPDLVIWQVGTNDVLWQSGAASAAVAFREGMRRLREANADIILMDLQDAPMVRRKPTYAAMQALIAEVAREQSVGLFPRFAVMERAHAQGVNSLVSIDGLHNSAIGYQCVGRALARMIDADVAR